MYICGDLCINKFRHTDYITSKIKNENFDTISKKDSKIKIKLTKFIQYYVWVYGNYPFDKETKYSRKSLMKEGVRIGMTDNEIIKLLNNDKDFQTYLIEKCVQRDTLFINECITKIEQKETYYIINEKYKLINLDNFYLHNKNRKKLQYMKLENS